MKLKKIFAVILSSAILFTGFGDDSALILAAEPGENETVTVMSQVNSSPIDASPIDASPVDASPADALEENDTEAQEPENAEILEVNTDTTSTEDTVNSDGTVTDANGFTYSSAAKTKITSFKNPTVNDVKQTTVVIPDTVTEIGKNAFSYSTDCVVTALTLNANLETIGQGAFKNQVTLTSIDFTKSTKLSTISQDAFYGNILLASVTLPESLLTLEADSFGLCTALETVTINSKNLTCTYGITTASSLVNAGPFTGCTNSSFNIVLPSDITKVPDYLYANSSISTVTISSDVTEVGTGAFYDCDSLATVTFAASDKLNKIDAYAFSLDQKLTAISIPNSCTYIGVCAFTGDKLLATANLPTSLECIGSGAFTYCESLTTITIPKTLREVEYNSNLKGPAATSADFIVENCGPFGRGEHLNNLSDTKFTTINFESGVTTIPAYLFANYMGSTVSIPSEVTTIGQYAFWNAENITSLTIPSNITDISAYAFAGTSITSITIPEGVTIIRDHAFYKTDLTSVEIPDQTKKIESYAFNTSTLTSVYIPPTVTYIADNRSTICGKDTLTITGVAKSEAYSYAKKYSINFIAMTDLSRAKITIKTGNVRPYTGSAVTFDSSSVIVKVGTATVDSDCYEVSYLNNTDAGTGTALMVIKGKKDKYCTGTAEYYFSIEGYKITDTKKIEITVEKSAYTGEVIKPAITIKNLETNKTLIENTDYKLAYTETNKPGTYTATIIGIKNYEGSKTVKYTITKGNFAEAKDSGTTGIVVPQLSAVEYTGLALKPAVSVSFNGILLTENKDYTLSYSKNTSVGTGKVTIKGKGNFAGTLVRTFTINKKKIVDSSGNLSSGMLVTVEDAVYAEGKAATPKVTVKLINSSTGKTIKTLAAGKDYSRLEASSYSNNTSKGTGSVTITAIGGYFEGSYTASFRIATSSIGAKTVKVEKISDQEYKLAGYTTSDLQSLIKIKDGSSELKYGTDYELASGTETITSAGTVTVSIKGMNDYCGSRKISFKVKKGKASDFFKSLTVINENNTTPDSFVYTGYKVTPKVIVKSSSGASESFIEGTDYKLSYSSNTNVGIAKIKISGIGNFSGYVTTVFAISTLDLSTVNVAVTRSAKDASNPVYNNGKAAKTYVTITVDDNGVTRTVKNSALKMALSLTKTVGTAGYDIAPPSKDSKNVKSAKTGIFTIDKANASDFVISKVSPMNYKGKTLTPAVTVKYNGKTLRKNIDYEVSYSSNDAKGVATITVTGVSHYFEGTQSINFIIK